MSRYLNRADVETTGGTIEIGDWVPATLDGVSEVGLKVVAEIGRVKVGQSVVDVTVERIVRAVFDQVNQARDEIGSKGDDESLNRT